MFLIKYKIKWHIDYVINAGLPLARGWLERSKAEGEPWTKSGCDAIVWPLDLGVMGL